MNGGERAEREGEEEGEGEGEAEGEGEGEEEGEGSGQRQIIDNSLRNNLKISKNQCFEPAESHAKY